MSYIDEQDYQPERDWQIDLFFDSPSCPPLAFLDESPPQQDLQLCIPLQLPVSESSPSSALTRPKLPNKTQKVSRIRTSRNSQKTYHNILKHYLLSRNMDTLVNKYGRYFSQRVYFVLLLQEILKQEEGMRFLEEYKEFADEVRRKKTKEIMAIQSSIENCEQIQHLKRVMQQVEYSVAACKECVEGNVLDALIIVFKRHQKKITKVKEFKEAVRIFQAETGYAPENL